MTRIGIRLVVIAAAFLLAAATAHAQQFPSRQGTVDSILLRQLEARYGTLRASYDRSGVGLIQVQLADSMQIKIRNNPDSMMAIAANVARTLVARHPADSIRVSMALRGPRGEETTRTESSKGTPRGLSIGTNAFEHASVWVKTYAVKSLRSLP